MGKMVEKLKTIAETSRVYGGVSRVSIMGLKNERSHAEKE
jgi:hypothetical protein